MRLAFYLAWLMKYREKNVFTFSICIQQNVKVGYGVVVVKKEITRLHPRFPIFKKKLSSHKDVGLKAKEQI